MSDTYLQRRADRSALRELKRVIVFGISLATFLVLLGTWRRFVVPGTLEPLWNAVSILGLLLLVLSLVLPTLLIPAEAQLRRLSQKIGAGVLLALLTLLYFLCIWPIGAILRRTRGSDPIYRWDGAIDKPGEGWRAKEIVCSVSLRESAHRSTLHRALGVFAFFARRKHYLVLPTLLILLLLGVVLLFVHSSALAPLIYTLF